MGHAKDYVRMMWLILQSDTPEDWVISTGKTTSIRDFVKIAFKYLGIELKFKGKGKNEVGVVVKCNNKEFQLDIGKEVVAVDHRYFRPTEVDLLIGDSSKAKNKLGWEPQITLEELIEEMMESDLKECRKEKLLNDNGFNKLNYYK